MNIERRVYRHYKGNPYMVLGTAIHYETKEESVIYRYVYGDDTAYLRPLKEWFEEIEYEGKIIPRFKVIEKK